MGANVSWKGKSNGNDSILEAPLASRLFLVNNWRI